MERLKDQRMWDRARAHIALAPHLGRKRVSIQDLLPLPWDKAKVGGQDAFKAGFNPERWEVMKSWDAETRELTKERIKADPRWQ